MESIPTVSTSIVLTSNNPLRQNHPSRRISLAYSTNTKNHHNPPSLCSFFSSPSFLEHDNRKRREMSCASSSGGGGGGEDEKDDDLERALHMDGRIPLSSEEFVKQVSSRAYDMRRHLEQTIDNSSYDVLEANPWREASKPVYVLTQRENQLCTMKTRRSRSEVEREFGMLFSKSGKQRPEIGNKAKQSRSGTKFRMHVEDVREGVLVFEDEQEATRYCDLLQGGGQGCEGIAELEASSVFDICHKMRALAVLFRRGKMPPLPESLKLNLKAKKRSLEDQDDLI
ncbi:plant/protein [Tasmannia lanceolata]|uniref:plant/protein n=1 Tax=Tasmannia lanceolata TaxID=3420 RepID=UPI0040634190